MAATHILPDAERLSPHLKWPGVTMPPMVETDWLPFLVLAVVLVLFAVWVLIVRRMKP